VGYKPQFAFSAKSHCPYTLPLASEMPPHENAVRPHDAREFLPYQG